MGHEIVYCAHCQTRILGTELEKGRAFAFSNRFCCKACVPELLKTLPPEDRAGLLAVVSRPHPEPRPELSSSSTALRALRSSSTRIPAQGPGGHDTTRRRTAGERKSSGLAVGLGVGGAAVAILLVALLASGGKTPEPAATVTPPRTGQDVPRPGPAGTEEPLREAREFERRNPQDLDGQIRAWDKAVWACEGSRTLEEAKRGLAGALARRKELAAKELARLETDLGALLAKESFRAALDLLETARKRFEHPDWTLPVDRKISELREKAAAAFAAAHAEAGSARARGAAADVRAAVDRVGRWGLTDYSDRMKEFLAEAPAPAPAPPPAPAPAADRTLPVWEKAMARAALRDYAAALKELSEGAALSPDVAAEIEVLRKAGTVATEAREAMKGWVRGQKLSVDAFDGAGRIVRIEAAFQRIEETRLVLGSAEEPQSVEIGELAPSTLAALFLARSKKTPEDERAAAVFCLAEGDLEGAGRLQGTKAALAGRYWDWGRKVAAGRAVGREAEARALFAVAEEGGDDPVRAAASVAAFQDLLARFGDTAFVARNREAIAAHGAGAREFSFFPDLLVGTGGFRLSKSAKGETAWVSERDGDPAQVVSNYVEFAFSAPPNSEYRGWVYAGACCLETFEFGVQATGLKTADPKNAKEAVAADPGGPNYAIAKIPFFLRKTHASHGGPKTASRWDWIPIPLPKFSEGGLKTVRVLSVQQGFSVAYAVVSSVPEASPRLLEVKDRERSRAARQRPPPPPPETGLVGHWKLDEGQGTTARDSSPRGHHAALAGAVWTQGRFGGALRFDGDNSCVELPSSPVLDGLQGGDYTLSAWFKPEATPPGKDPANDANYGILIKRGMHVGIHYGGGQQFHAGHFFSNDAWVGASTPARGCPPGVFHHVASVFERKAAAMQIYLNGRLIGSGTGAPGTAARGYGNERWRIGCASPGAAEWRWTAKGVVDEIRMYDRALSPGEVRALAGARGPATPAPPPPDARPWTVVPLEKLAGPGYRVEDGVLVRVPGTDNAARSPMDFGDVEMRIRFEHTVSGYLFFAIRQGGDGAYVAHWNRGPLEQMEKKEHELVFVCKGDSVTATLDGKPQELERRGSQPRSGALQFNINPGAELKVKSVEIRDPLP